MTMFNFKMQVPVTGYIEYQIQMEADSIEEAVNKATTILEEQNEYKTEGFEVIDTEECLYQTSTKPMFVGEVV